MSRPPIPAPAFIPRGVGAGHRAVAGVHPPSLRRPRRNRGAWRFVGRCGATVREYGPIGLAYLAIVGLFPGALGAASVAILLTPAGAR